MQTWYEGTGERVLAAEETSGVGEWQLESLLEGYNARNFTTRYETSSALWLSAPPPALGEENRHFRVNMTVRIPTERVEYSTEWSECLKMAFVQYATLFLLSKYLLDVLREYLYENQVFESQVVVDSQSRRVKEHSF